MQVRGGFGGLWLAGGSFFRDSGLFGLRFFRSLLDGLRLCIRFGGFFRFCLAWSLVSFWSFGWMGFLRFRFFRVCRWLVNAGLFCLVFGCKRFGSMMRPGTCCQTRERRGKKHHNHQQRQHFPNHGQAFPLDTSQGNRNLANANHLSIRQSIPCTQPLLFRITFLGRSKKTSVYKWLYVY
jgi:hypothetical protein